MRRVLWALRLAAAVLLVLVGGLCWLLAWLVSPEDVKAAAGSSVRPSSPSLTPGIDRDEPNEETASGKHERIH